MHLEGSRPGRGYLSYAVASRLASLGAHVHPVGNVCMSHGDDLSTRKKLTYARAATGVSYCCREINSMRARQLGRCKRCVRGLSQELRMRPFGTIEESSLSNASAPATISESSVCVVQAQPHTTAMATLGQSPPVIKLTLLALPSLITG